MFSFSETTLFAASLVVGLADATAESAPFSPDRVGQSGASEINQKTGGAD